MKARCLTTLLMFMAVFVLCVLVGEPGWRGFRYWIYNSRHNDGTSLITDRRVSPPMDIRRGIGFCRASVRVKDPRDVLLAACSGHPLRSLSLFDLFYQNPIELEYRSSNLGTREVSSLVRDLPFQEDASSFLLIYNTDNALFPVCDIHYILQINRGKVFDLVLSEHSKKTRVVEHSGTLLNRGRRHFNTVDRDQRGEQVLKRWHQARQAANWQLSPQQEASFEAEFYQCFDQ